LIYRRKGQIEAIHPSWKPSWYLSYSDQIGVTSQAVKHVQQLHEQQPKTAIEIDQAMQIAVDTAKSALLTNESFGIANLLKAINQAKICFSRWGLADGKIATHIQQLTNAGAIACKPTGSGNGGYVLSLWTEAPKHTEIEMIPV